MKRVLLLVQFRVFTLLCGIFFIFNEVNGTPAVDSVATIELTYRFLVDREDPAEKLSAIARADSVIEACRQSNNHLLQAYIRIYKYFTEANIHHHPGSMSTYFLAKKKEIERMGFRPLTAWYKFKLGQLLIYEKNYIDGFSQMLEAVSESRAYGLNRVPLASYMFYDLSIVYYNFNNYRQSISLSLEASRYATRYPSTASIANTLGMCYQKLGLYDSAASIFAHALQLAAARNDSVWMAIVSGNLGRTFCLKGNYITGLQKLYTDVYYNRYREPVNSAISALYVAEAHRLTGRLDSCATYIALARQMFTYALTWQQGNLGNSMFGYHYYHQLGQWFAAQKQFDKAYAIKDSAIFYRDLFRSLHNINLIAASEKRVQGLEYQQSLALANAQKRNAANKNTILVISIIGLLLLTTLFISRQRLKLLKERQQHADKERHLELLRTKADNELQQAKIQLEDYLKFIEEKNQLIEAITLQLETPETDTPRKPTEALQHIKQQLIGASLLTQADWDVFQQKFEKVHPGFFVRIRSYLPGVTSADERLLALGKLELGTRQMGMMLGISPESVRKAKYRLRKKIAAIDHNDELTTLAANL